MLDRDLHPTEGARFLLELEREHSGRAHYRASIYTPESVFTGALTLDDRGGTELVATGAPAELDDRLRSIAKLVARDAAKRVADGLPAWPSRILRWRR
ncbi:MAG: hypothetical protein AB7P03_00195 [Kofleriaceae bacterium]